MTKQTTQELQKIVDDAPEGATHIDTNRPVFYYKIDSFVTEYFTGEVWKDACNVIPAIEDIKSLDDIREILKLRKRGESLEKQRNAILNTAIRSEEKYADLKESLAIRDLEQQAKCDE